QPRLPSEQSHRGPDHRSPVRAEPGRLVARRGGDRLLDPGGIPAALTGRLYWELDSSLGRSVAREANFESWGRYPKARHEVLPLRWRGDPLPGAEGSVLPYGLGRSYGDSCLNDGGSVLFTRGLDRLISFD